MSPLKCHTVHEAIWERAASAGPAPLSPALAHHLVSCAICQAESRAVAELVELAPALPDAPPPDRVWDGFDEELARRLAGGEPLLGAWRRWGRRAASIAAVLVVGFALGVTAARMATPSVAERAAAERAAIFASLAEEARLEAYLASIEERLASQSGADAFVAGPAAPSAEAGERLVRAAAERERLRRIVLALVAAELEAESYGFGYLDRRIASLAGERFLYIVP